MIEVNESVISPKLCPKLFPSHHFPVIGEQHEQYLERLLAHL